MADANDSLPKPRWWRYLIVVNLTWLLLGSCVVAVNVVGDAGVIYLQRFYTNQQVRAFAREILSEKVGVEAGGNEREMKHALARQAGAFDCVVIGSSRSLQVSTLRKPSSVARSCERLLNLGVSGAAIEDVLVYSRVVLDAWQMPERMYLALDPWMLQLGKDARYGVFEEDYRAMLDELETRGAGGVSYRERLAMNLLNAEYFRASAEVLWESGFDLGPREAEGHAWRADDESAFRSVPAFDFSHGYERPVWLADGSFAYSTAQLEAKLRRVRALKTGGGGYKLGNDVTGSDAIDDDTVELVAKLITLLGKRGIEVSILLMPYHPTVFEGAADGPLHTIVAVEERLRQLAANHGVAMYGSYDPRRLGCSPEWFHDDMHPSKACVDRVDFGPPTRAKRDAEEQREGTSTLP
jgi:hypothetical protein